MFTKKVVESDAFLDLPFSAQCLYFHLNMNADDDGFLNSPGKIIRIAGASQEDLQSLIDKRFVLDFGNGVIVIKHWKMHNTLKKDRYKQTQYQKQFALLSVKENGAYTERNHNGTILEPEWNHSVDKYSVVKESIGKDSVVEERGTNTNTPAPPSLPQITDFVKNNGLSVNPNRFFSYYNEREWKTPAGNPVDWETKILEWDYDEKQKQKAKQAEADKPGSNPFLNLAKDENLF